MKIGKVPLKKNKEEWEELSELDIYWAILADSEKKFGKWDIKDFFKTSEQEINNLVKLAKKLGCLLEQEVALDFGCGIGRITRQLARYFKKCYGVDISENMIARAKKLNSSLLNCEFVINTKDNLAVFSDNYFDLIYSKLVLQHLPDKKLIKNYISEFVRTLKKKGLLMFQLPCYVPLSEKIQLRPGFYKVLKWAGINKKFLYENLKLNPSMTMNSLPEKEIIKLLEGLDVKILKIQKDKSAGPLIKSRIYYITK